MRIHGRSGIAYLGRNAGDAASPAAFLDSWEITVTREVFDVTAVTDSQVSYGAGITGVSGGFTGFYDTATAQSYAAAVDGLPRNLYLYPSLALPGTFFSGSVLPDYGIRGGTSSACALAVTWAAVTAVTRVAADTGVYAAAYASTY